MLKVKRNDHATADAPLILDAEDLVLNKLTVDGSELSARSFGFSPRVSCFATCAAQACLCLQHPLLLGARGRARAQGPAAERVHSLRRRHCQARGVRTLLHCRCHCRRFSSWLCLRVLPRKPQQFPHHPDYHAKYNQKYFDVQDRALLSYFFTPFYPLDKVGIGSLQREKRALCSAL